MSGSPKRVTPIAPSLLEGLTVATFETSAGAVDVLTEAAGGFTYDDLVARAEPVSVGGQTILLAGLGDVIAMKRAAGRPKDLRVVEELEAIQASLTSPGPWSPGGPRSSS